jgi:hypothetical protein
MLRAVHVAVYAALATLAMSLVARPAALWLRSLGLFGPRLLWEVPLGWVFAATAGAIVACTVSLALGLSLKRETGLAKHAALLLLVAAALALRSAASEPRPLPARRPPQARPPASVAIPAYRAARIVTAP